MSDDELARFVAFADEHPGLVSRHHLLQKLAIFDFVYPIVARHPHETILEIGCGYGVHSALLSQFGRVSATELQVPGSFVGANHDVGSGRETVLRGLAKGEVQFAHNDGRRLPYPDRTFDIVFHNSVIEHVPDVVAYNQEVLRVLKPGGICICITGTPMLCAFRFVGGFVLKLPFILAVAVARELGWASRLATAALAAAGISVATRGKVAERLQRVDRRLGAVAGLERPAAAAAAALRSRVNVRAHYARLYHYLYFPSYNRIVLDEIAREHGVSVEELLRCMELHFRGRINRLRFSLTPRTHGQHYRNARHEMREWRLPRWEEQFRAAGFAVDILEGFRFHQVLEATPSYKWDSALYYRAVRMIHGADWLRARPKLSSEFILVARRPLLTPPETVG